MEPHMTPRKPIFDELDHRLSVIPRWSILHTIQKQNVAMHVHNVVRITIRIGHEWFKLNNEELLAAVLWAHHHDDDESICGDIQAPAKMYFDHEKFEKDHESHFIQAPPEHIYKIVKLADRMEWIYFLRMEMALGNEFVAHQYADNYDKLLALAFDFFGRDIRLRVMDWSASIDPRSQNYNKRW